MITARCHPALEPLLPRPTPAGPPDWVKAMPSEVSAESLGGDTVRTVKHCPPFLDAMNLGVMIPLVTDLRIKAGEVAWDWDPPHLPDTLISRAPIGVHVAEQTTGAPYRLAVNAVLKFMNFWTLETSPGWSLLFMHPLNREDLPFRTLSGVVDCDRFNNGYVHFPALWLDPNFEGVLPKGTPIAQVVPVDRSVGHLTIEPMTEAQIAENTRVQSSLQAERGVYRKTYRRSLEPKR